MTDDNARRTILQKVVDEHTAHAVVGTVSVAVEKWAEELAQEAIDDPEFRKAFRAMVRASAKAMMESLNEQDKADAE